MSSPLTTPKREADATVVVLPTYNERENVPLLVPRILDRGPDWHVLVVDDASPDGTGELAEGMAADEPRLRVLRREGPRGLGLSYRDGLSLALSEGFAFVFTMDSDFSHNPKRLLPLREMARDAGVALGSRYVRGGGATDWSWMRRLNSYAANALTRSTLGLRVHDASSGYRCFRRDALARIEPASLTAEGFSIMEELSYRVERVGLRWAEHPIVFEGRQKGESKISPLQVLDVVAMLVRLRLSGWQPRRRLLEGRAPSRPRE